MHVLFVSGEFRPHSTWSGGIGTHFAAFAEGLRRLGHEVTVVTRQPVYGTVVTDSGVRIVGVPDPQRGGPLSAAGRAARLVPHVRREKGDIMVAAEWGGEAAFVVRDRPLVTILETSLPQLRSMEPENWTSARRRSEGWVQGRLERHQTLRSDAVIGSSHAIAKWASELWPIREERLSVLPNFLDIPAIQRVACDPAPRDIGSPYVLYFGRLEPRKGVHVLAKAMTGVWERYPEVRLVLAGTDREFGDRLTSEVIREICGDNAAKVEFIGNQDPADLLPLVAGAQAVVFPSLWENFSLGAIEAMAVGATIVATTGSGFVDFMTDGEDALLVPPAEPEPLARAVERVLADRALAERLSVGARNRAETELSLLTGTQRFVDAFAQLCGR